MAVRAEVKAAPTMLVAKVEAPVTVMWGKMVVVKVTLVMEPVLVEFPVVRGAMAEAMVETGMKFYTAVVMTRVEMALSSKCPSRGSPTKDKQG